MRLESSKNQYEMQDPTKQYPRIEFPAQTQQVPGLAREMDPKPDHGEESLLFSFSLILRSLNPPPQQPPI